MKVLDETRFKDKYSKERHHRDHVAKSWIDIFTTPEGGELLEPMTVDEYDDNADLLSRVKVTTSDYDIADRFVGFKCKDGRNLKMDKFMQEVVVYVAEEDDQSTITYYRVADGNVRNRYNRLKRAGYARDLLPDDDKHNF